MQDVSSWKVLIVDDEPDNIGVVKLVMEFYDAAVLTAASGQACLETLEDEIPTLMLIDIQMPGMSGFDLLRKMREREAWRHIPVIAVTAHTMHGDRERILNAGFDGYIGKPISAMTLVNDLTRIMDAREKR